MNKGNFLILLKWGGFMGVGLAVVNYLRDYTATLDFYPFAPVLDLLMILIFIGCLYAGIKEYRNALPNQLIKFMKAFLVGGEVTLVAVVVFFIYLLINFNFIDNTSLEKINAKNEARYYEKIKNDTLSKQEIVTYLAASFAIIDDQREIIFNSVNPDSSCIELADSRINSLKSSFEQSLLSTNPDDTVKTFSSFEKYSYRTFTTLSQQYCNVDDSIQKPCISNLSSIFVNSAEKMKHITPLQVKYKQGLSTVIHYNSEISAACFLAIPVLIYGLLFNLFVSFFLFRKKMNKEENEPQPDSEDDNQNIENK